MRIISQDGTIDIPYDRYVISTNMQDSKEIIAWSDVNISSDDCIVLANYSSSEKSFNAMKMVREAYMGLPVVFQNTNIDDSVLESFKNHNVVLLKSYDNPQSKVEYVNSGIFQFPKDDEIEV